MKRILVPCLLLAGLTPSVGAAEEPASAEKKSGLSDAIRARLIEDAKKGPKPNAEAPKTATAQAALAPVPKEPAPTPKETPEQDKAKKQDPTMLPQVEVRRDRVTVLDVKIAEQERDIAAEKVNTHPTELDKALNDSKVTKALSFLGGESAQHRATVANERVHLMEAEKDILEAMKVARTKDEKQELQKQLDEIRTMRRELESSLR
jgi:hypothetical protein